MASKCRVAIVMPAYNRANVIQHAIRSVVDQTYKDWNLIVVDDGSQDGTKRIVESFANPRITYKKIDHCGFVSKVRNIGNKMAEESGAEIIIVHDSDDQAFPDRVEEIVKCFDETNADIVYHGMYVRHYDPFHNAVARQIRPALPYNKEQLLTSQYIPGQIAYKTRVVMETPYDDRVRCCDDYQILLEFALKGYKFAPIFKNLYEYYDSPDSINVSGEMDGSRRKDVEVILSILREKYGVHAIAGLIKNTLGDEMPSEIISREIIK